MHHVSENLDDARLVDRDAEDQASLVQQRRRKPEGHRLDGRRMQEHEAVRVLLRQALVGGAGVREVCDIPPIDVEDHERQVVGAALLRDRGAEEYPRTVERYEVVRSDWRGRLQTLRPLRVADPGGASGVQFSCCAGTLSRLSSSWPLFSLKIVCRKKTPTWREANILFGLRTAVRATSSLQSRIASAVPRLADDEASNFDAPAAASLPLIHARAAAMSGNPVAVTGGQVWKQPVRPRLLDPGRSSTSCVWPSVFAFQAH